MPKKLKVLWLWIIAALTVYGPIEITRLIVEARFYPYHPQFEPWMFVGELVAMWTCYIAGLVVVYRVMK